MGYGVQRTTDSGRTPDYAVAGVGRGPREDPYLFIRTLHFLLAVFSASDNVARVRASIDIW
jgi:hypothetical protein